MIEALFSIRPEFSEKILNGIKIYEYRKIFPSKKIDKIIIYSTYPVNW